MYTYQPTTKLPEMTWKCLKCGRTVQGNAGCLDCNSHSFDQMTPEQRFNSIERQAIEFFGTTRWKTNFANRYGITSQAIWKWQRQGAPIWAAQAMDDALRAKRLAEATEALRTAMD